MSVWEDFIDIFYAPSAVFARRANGNFWIPLLVVTLLTGGLFILNHGALQPMFDAEFDRGMQAAARQGREVPPEAVERMRNITSGIGRIAVFVFLPLGILCVGVVTWLAGKIVDAKETFRAALIVSAYSFVPRIPEAVISGLQGVLLEPESLDGRFRLTFGPGRFLDPDTTSPVLLALVGRLDLFTLWITVLIAIGLSVTGGIPRSRAAFAAAIAWFAGAIPLFLQALQSLS